MNKETKKYSETADIETASADYATRFAGAAGRFFLDEQTRITLGLLAGTPARQVLDVGGGHCQLALPLVRNGYAVTITGSDESCGARVAERLPAGTYAYQTCDSLALPFADRAFPTVLSFRLLPHVARWPELVAELCRVADDTVIVDYPDIRSFNLLYRLLFRLKKRMEGNTRTYTLFSRREIAAAFAANGFSCAFTPQFFWPMVLHRKLENAALSRLLESPCRAVGLTRLFGSPIIVRATRNHA